MSELPKTFDPGSIEQRWYEHWESRGLFRPERPDAEPWTIVNPPPNVTGSLHIGHALDNSLQDIVTRHARMQGKDALWVVGTDHAGIATQMVVERNLEQRQDKRTNYSRDEFVAKVWEWKEESGGEITRQLRRLGCSMDWSNERFTMDEGFTRAVLKVFVQLYREGLLYRDKRLVNWDPKFQSAISDLEVDSREVAGHMWHFKYPLAGGRTYTYVERDEDGNVLFEEERDYISIATTRPETMLGDGAVAVHPDDERYRPIVGSFCEIPVGPKEHRRLIPIITDSYPDPDFGSGAVKITGAHDLNDYGVAQRNDIPMYRLMDERAHMRSDGAPYAECAERARAIAKGEAASAAEVDELNLVPDAYRGLDRYEARNRVVADIDSEGLMIKVEDKPIMQPFGDRSGVVIEPMLTDQWYVDAATLARPAIEAARSGKIEIVPKTWEKTWFNWLENIQPWCVSRQLWWGHRIPAWYDEDGKVYVAETEEEARDEAGGKPLRQDEDVLDTWFSSALWPFATIGWPERTRELERHYPNDLLISGFDIIFFWDARMAMQGIHFMKEVPWKRLYLHGLVRDAQGQKMSKSKGNTVDPLGLIDQYGADALRFTLAAMESQGRDIKLDEKRVEGYRNFATKLWNAARFLQMNGVGASESIAAPTAELPVNRWIIGEVVETLAKMDRAFEELRFDDMADAIYHFTWGTFCDWYVELVKGAFDEETKRVAAWAFDQILVMLHPLMPFITEELWNANERPYELIVAKWPEPEAVVDLEAKGEIERVIEIISAIRTQRTEIGLPPGARFPLAVLEDPQSNLQVMQANTAVISQLARVKPAKMEFSEVEGMAEYRMETRGSTLTVTFQQIDQPSQYWDTSIQIPTETMVLVIGLDGFADLSAERERLTKALAAVEKERDSLSARLQNPNFVERAKPEAVEKARSDHAEKSLEAERYRAALERLG